MRFKLRWSDLLAAMYFIVITLLLFLQRDQFISLTKAYPYLLGFLKVALLATFGECLKHRIGSDKSWIPSRIVIRFFVWGLFGMWFTWAFPHTDGGVTALIAQGFWPNGSAVWLAFSKSLSINILSGYAFFMMLIHFWFDVMIDKRFCSLWGVFGESEARRWAKRVILSIPFFWLGAHTGTFSLPPEWRIVCAAYLAVCLGATLAFAEKRS